MPSYEYGLRGNPAMSVRRHPEVSPQAAVSFGSTISAVSLFSGCGGMDLGFLGGFDYRGEYYRPLPFHLRAAYDFDARATETYRLNLNERIKTADLTEVPASDIPPARLLLGGFPCQDFSSSGPKVGLDGKRGRLYSILVDHMREHRPEMVIAENVPHLARMRGGDVLRTVLDDMSAPGYVFDVWKLHCADYGLPQSRTRLFIVGVREDIPVRPAPPARSHVTHRSIGWAIEDLEDVHDETIPNQSQYFVATKATAGAGQGDQTSERDKLAFAMRANPKARVHFHYYLERRLTVRECARIQSFPDDFVFPHSASSNIMQIGNAVPPIVGHAVAESLAAFFEALDSGDTDGMPPNVTQPVPVQVALF
jgi:DNA (cytosine-5)-methyltransferase 1